MNAGFEHYAKRVMSGAERGPRAAALRVGLTAASVPYAAAAATRNVMFDAGLRKPARLPRPVVSIGNITAGGTGKTPVVRWLAENLRAAGQTVAVLSRGYKAASGELGDEQRMLDGMLNRPGLPHVRIRANPSRLRAGKEVLRAHPEVSVYLLDDGFQHRQLARDFDLVLVNAAEPFGFGRVLPRGTLREPLRGLRRASAFLLTRCDQAGDAALTDIRRTLHAHNPAAPVFASDHAPARFRDAQGTAVGSADADGLRGRRWFAFCGIGEPESFVRQLTALSGGDAAPSGSRAFADHHAYTDDDFRALRAEAARLGADVLVTTEKDWVKLAPLPALREPGPPVWRLDVELRFRGDDEGRLLAEIERAIATRHV